MNAHLLLLQRHPPAPRTVSLNHLLHLLSGPLLGKLSMAILAGIAGTVAAAVVPWRVRETVVAALLADLPKH